MTRHWTTKEIEYVCAHATDGAQAIAQVLGRSEKAVVNIASKYGVSLRRRYFCPSCSRYVLTPLSPKTGWCRVCSIRESRDNAARKNCEIRRELKREQLRVIEAKRARQLIYSDTDRMKGKIKRLKAKA